MPKHYTPVTGDLVPPVRGKDHAILRTGTSGGMKGLSIPTVWVFPKLLVCLDCGAAEFLIPDEERKVLIDRDYRDLADEAAV